MSEMTGDRKTPSGHERTFAHDELIVSKTDPKGRLTYVNDVFLTVSGYVFDSQRLCRIRGDGETTFGHTAPRNAAMCLQAALGHHCRWPGDIRLCEQHGEEW
ncbi:hypothetical protein MCP1_540014 [Candidatus Terasakiella magnetica]|nr:hypothetical protein MCP1_540014 [Candidatus Terasakiella magnetica]